MTTMMTRRQQPVGQRMAALFAKAVRPARTLVAGVACTLAEHRFHRAAIEMELYGRRYKLATKNDDDLPIVPQTTRRRCAVG